MRFDIYLGGNGPIFAGIFAIFSVRKKWVGNFDQKCGIAPIQYRFHGPVQEKRNWAIFHRFQTEERRF